MIVDAQFRVAGVIDRVIITKIKMDQIEDNDGMSKSSMLSLKELVDLFASPPA